MQKSPVDPLGHKEGVHRLELGKPFLHQIGNLPNSNLDVDTVTSFGLVIEKTGSSGPQKYIVFK